ncbi:MAG: hypothetical protein ACJ8BW_13695 [Ktedonobacteraceae bacterium]|jgi:hypothetical protein
MRRKVDMKAINRHDVWIYRPLDDVEEEELLAENIEWSAAVEIAETARKTLRFCSLLDSVRVIISATAKAEVE